MGALSGCWKSGMYRLTPKLHEQDDYYKLSSVCNA
jgi:hypothetical protein